MKNYIILFIISMSFIQLSAQPVINKDDMPAAGDTIRLSISNNANGIDYALTGTNYLWDFSSLNEQSQRVDTFVSVSTCPLVYQADFTYLADSAHKASFAQPQPDITTLPNVQFTEVYNFFRVSDYTYTQVGQGAKINAVPTPIRYNDPDLLYTFPLTYGVTDSSQYEYHLNITGLGYYGETKKRVNIVDGWGTLITPYDTLLCIRVFSTSYIHDTIFADTLGFGFAQDRTEKEYKWLTDTIGLPALRVIKSGGGGNVSLEYKHEFIPSGANTNEYPYTLTFLSMYPNPADVSSKIYFALSKSSEVNIDIMDATGRIVFTLPDNNFPEGFSSVDIGKNISSLSKGFYFLNIRAGSNIKTIKFTIL
jgi:hypothetical protein